MNNADLEEEVKRLVHLIRYINFSFFYMVAL